MTQLEAPRYAARRLEPLLTITEAAEVLGVQRSTIYRLLRDSDLVAVRVGKRLRFRPSDLEDYLERHREAAR